MYKTILLLTKVPNKYKVSLMVAFIICTLSVLSLLSSVQVHAQSPYESGYDHGCDDAEISDPSDRYTNQPEKGPSYHTDEFNNGYNSGFSACSSSGTSGNAGNNDDDKESSNNDGENSDGVNQFSSSGGSQSGYQLTVNVPSHPFGKSSVSIYITTENGYKDSKTVSTSTAGDPSGTFNIPPNQGDTVKVCVDSGLISLQDCETYSVAGGGDREVSLAAP